MKLPPFAPEPISLSGTEVVLEPLALKHAAELFEAARDPSIWGFMPLSGFPNVGSVEAWINTALEAARSGEELPFAIFLRASGRTVGSTRYLEIRREHRGLEIGWTWLSPEVQRTRVNTEAKHLLLRHAFETLGAIRVQFKTDGRNVRSQRAIERIGGVKEGVLRRHKVLPDGYVRDSVYYSILDGEWPGVKGRLEKLLSI